MRRFILFAAAVALLVSGCADSLIRPKVEKGIAAALPDYIGPAKEYRVQASGSGTRMLKGKIDRLHIEGIDVQLEEDMIVDRLIIDMDRVVADTETRKLKSVDATAFRGEMSGKSVNMYVQAVRPDVAGLKIELKRNSVVVTAHPTVLGIGPEVRVEGRPVIAGRNCVNFVADKSSLSVLPVPAVFVNKLLEQINPVLDLTQAPFPLTLSKVTVGKDVVTMEGTASLLMSTRQ